MYGSLRVPSVLGLLLFVGWSVLVNARERLVPQRERAAPRARSAPEQPPVDRKLWN
jgi:hypothetical protein